ncbi:type II toxin-antitoxin system VapC family toxin [Microbacterium sp.]|uniref:type II toxin-antitoxin system VapC family toxin n=1 Tax=Microbacterium sp. TaxID=51671 RepID=UPI003F9A4339
MILLDTSVLIDIDNVALPRESIVLSSLAAAELQFGIEHAATIEIRRQRMMRFGRLTRLLEAPWLPFDEAAARSYGRLAAIVARTRPSHARGKDVLLAGHAHALGARLATLNPKDFELVADEVEIIVPQLRT